MHPMTEVSFDGGASWVMAAGPAERLHAKMFGGDGSAAIAPIGVEGWCLASGYVALLWPIFGGGLAVSLAWAGGFSNSLGLGARLLFILAGFVFGPTPIALVAWRGLVRLRRDPTYHGRGRAIFALVIAGLMAFPCFLGIVGLFVA